MVDVKLANPVVTVAIFSNGKEPKLKEMVRFVTSLSENEHCIRLVSRPVLKGKLRKPIKQYFSKPEFFYVVQDTAAEVQGVVQGGAP